MWSSDVGNGQHALPPHADPFDCLVCRCLVPDHPETRCFHTGTAARAQAGFVPDSLESTAIESHGPPGPGAPECRPVDMEGLSVVLTSLIQVAGQQPAGTQGTRSGTVLSATSSPRINSGLQTAMSTDLEWRPILSASGPARIMAAPALVDGTSNKIGAARG